MRSDVLNTPIFRFNGEFSSDCQSKSVPLSLKCLVSMLLNSANIGSQDSEETRACLTIAQLILGNHCKTVGVVFPPYSQRNVFTVGAIDNLDHNPSSKTAQGLFHGTGISRVRKQSIQQNHCAIKTTPRDITLPNSYSIVPPVSLKISDVDVPAALQATDDISNSNQLSTAITKKDIWLEHCRRHPSKLFKLLRIFKTAISYPLP